jgi:hypothetical protein
VVTDELLTTVKKSLEGPVSVFSERRGFGKARGVPDSVFWLSPADNRIRRNRILPVLIELEGTFTGAFDDFRKFADRYGEEGEHQYSIQAPVVGELGTEGCLKRTKYDIIGIRANQLANADEIGEGQMHKEFDSWFENFRGKIRTRTSVKHHLPQTIIEWTVTMPMFGHKFEASIPFILSESEPAMEETIDRLTSPALPSVVVVNNKYDSRDHTTKNYETGVDLPTIHPIRFQD